MGRPGDRGMEMEIGIDIEIEIVREIEKER